MKDVQNDPAESPIPIDRVGIKNIRLPIKVRDRGKGRQDTVADVELSVDLPAHFKGTHMSRFVEALTSWKGELDYEGFKELVEDVRDRLSAKNAHLTFRFPYFLRKASPVSGAGGVMDYQCSVCGELENGVFRLTLGVNAPVMTVCPCSLAISDEGAHSQRAEVRILCRAGGFVWIEELIEIAEAAGSSPVYALLKREDEKRVTEQAFAKPAFVEDVVRGAAKALLEHPRIRWFKVEVESFESIHNHSAFASIERRKDPFTPSPSPAGG